MVVIADVLIFVPFADAIVSRLAGVFIQKLHQLLGVRDRQLAQHDGIEQAEDRSVGADPERQRKDGHRCEGGARRISRKA